MRAPCDVCCRVHRGPRCKPTDKRSVKTGVTLPGHVHRELVESVPWGERSAFIARATAAALEEGAA